MEDVWTRLGQRMGPLPEGRILAGFSGGADSAALLTLLLPLREAGRIDIEAVHVDHGLRGAESREDAAFAERFCRERGIPFHLYRLDLGERRDENAARQARHACFRRCLRERGIESLVLAHHRDDQAETFLLRLLRGAGPEGLGCMAAREEREGYTVYRPLLAISGGELREALKLGGIPWREDSSNAGDDYLRNRIRHGLLPEMERLCPGAGERIAGTAEMIGSWKEALEARCEGMYARLRGEGFLRAEELKNLPEAERRWILRRWWREQGPELDERSLDRKQTGALEALIGAERGRRANLPAGWIAERGAEVLHLIPPAEAPADPVPYSPAGVSFGGIRLITGPSRGHPGDGKFSQEVPADFPEGCVIRTRQRGDWIRPFGMAGRKSLQDYLTDRKIDAPFRDRIPLLCRGDEVLLAAGVGAGQVPSFQEGGEYIRLEWQGSLPWAGEGKDQHGKQG